MPQELRFRQIHLDFHTPDSIPGVGSEFDPDQFVFTLKEASVDSVTCFSRCHHGYIYHETKLPWRHPNLTCNLLEQQIRACHKADIKVPIYVTVGWDHLMARLHPEWCEMDRTGRVAGRGPLDSGGWTNLDFASPYVDYVVEQTQEVCDLFGDEVDGFFFDIMFQQGVHSRWCMERFSSLGLSPEDPDSQTEMREILVNECADRLFGAVREKNKNCSVFFNGGHVGPSVRRRLGSYTHLELESLPTGGWGYMHFPITCRYARTIGLDFLAMTGRFSESWGHFNSYKNPAALEYECLSSLALGGKCSIGDQLHPRGGLDKAAYELIGPVYRTVRALEPWCQGARAVAEIAVFNAEEFDASFERLPPANIGAARMLMEGRHQFDFVDASSDWSAYKVILLPDVIKLSDEGAAKLEDFIAQGGSVIASHESLRKADGGVLPAFLQVITAIEGEDVHSPNFLRPKESVHCQSSSDFVMYERGLRLRRADDAQVLATVSQPYFTRTWDKFISHAHSPVEHSSSDPGILQRGRIILFSHPIFTTYALHSMSFHRDIVLACLVRLLPCPLVRIEGPTSLQASLTCQGDRHVLHLLHYVPERRGLRFDIVEDPMPVLSCSAEIRVKASRAVLVPEGRELPLIEMEGGVQVEIPAFLGHAHICLE